MQPGQIDVWRISLIVSEDNLIECHRVLDVVEKKRAAAFLDDQDRSQWVAAHGQMRMILSRYTGTSAESISIQQKKGEKPFIENSQLRFNLSHTDGYALLAISNTGEVGVDIEYMKDNAKIHLISRSTFSESERQAILSVDGEEQKARFFRCWTRKEAFIKAIGKGFSYDTKSFSVSLESDTSSRFIQFHSGDYDVNQWNLLAFIPYPKTKAALAFAFTLTAIHLLEMESIEYYQPLAGEVRTVAATVAPITIKGLSLGRA